MQDEVSVSIFRPYGPNILKTKIPDRMVVRINELADEILASETLRAEKDWSDKLAGNVKHEVVLDLEQVDKLPDLIVALSRQYLEQSLKRLPNVAQIVLSAWVVSQYAGDFNPIHIHDSNLSGVVFLRLPPGFDEEYAREDHHPTAGCLELLGAVPNRYSEHSYVIKPEVGDCYLFPSWLTHQVYPFRSAGERRSMAFNVFLTPGDSETGAVGNR